jgi:hypothetical protein
MIIKIRSAHNTDGWFIFDNADSVFFSRHPVIKSFFADSMGQDATHNVIATDDVTGRKQGSFFLVGGVPPRVLGDPCSSEGWFVSFEHKGCHVELWGDTEAYMLNDSGKTIERIF